MSYLTFDDVLVKLRKGETFSFSRWGDGEWQCIFGEPGGNCDGHEYFPSLSLALRNVLCSKPAYHIAMQPKAMRDMGGRIKQWEESHRLMLNWDNADIFHDASIADRLHELNSMIKDKDVIIVANKGYEAGPFDLVPVPEKNAWLNYASTKAMLKNRIKRKTIVLYCAGMMSKVLIDDMHKNLAYPVTQIDCGSVFDPYLGIISRKYHKKIVERQKLCE